MIRRRLCQSFRADERTFAMESPEIGRAVDRSASQGKALSNDSASHSVRMSALRFQTEIERWEFANINGRLFADTCHVT